MILTYDVEDIAVEAKTPPLEALDVVIESGLKLKHDAKKRIVQACVSKETFRTLEEQYPSCFNELGAAILEDHGFGGTFELFDEDGLDALKDDAMVAAYVKQTEFSDRAWPRPDDNRRKLYPMRFYAGPEREERRAILRYPSATEIDKMLKVNTFAAYRDFLTKACVYGDLQSLEVDSPGTYLTLAIFMVGASSAGKVRRRGK